MVVLDDGRQDRAPARDAADRLADLRTVGVLGDVAGRAEAEALVDVLPADVNGAG